MSYEKTIWVDNKTVGTAQIMNNIEEGIEKVSSELETIANKGTTVEVLERVTKEEIDRQVEDGTIANLTIEDGSITSDKMSNESNIYIINNLFNYESVRVNTYLSNGVEVSNSQYDSSDFIKLKPSKYVVKYGDKDVTASFIVALYSTDKTFLKNITVSNGEFEITNKSYIRICYFKSTDKYLKYNLFLKKLDSTTSSNPFDSVNKLKIQGFYESLVVNENNCNFFEFSTNLIDESVVLKNKTTTDGITLIDSATFSITDYIDVDSKQDYLVLSKDSVAYSNAVIWFYDKKGNVIKTTSNISKIEIPFMAKLVRICIGNYHLYKNFKLEYNEITPYSVYSTPKIKDVYLNYNQGQNMFDKIAFLGDSFTAADVYTKRVANTLNSTYLNWGQGGQLLRDMPAFMEAKINGLQTNDIDLLCILGGTNDFSVSAQLGDIDSVSDRSTFYGSIKLMLDTAYKHFASKRIIFVTPTQRFGYKRPSGDVTTDTDLNGIHFSKYIKAIKEVCSLYSVPVYDSFSNLGVTNININETTTDGLHLTDDYYNRLGDCIAKFIINNI